MNSPKKPVKKSPEIVEKQGWSYNKQVGYNQACEDWQAYHDHIISQLPSKKELKRMVLLHESMWLEVKMKHQGRKNYSKVKELVNSIYARQRKGLDG